MKGRNTMQHESHNMPAHLLMTSLASHNASSICIRACMLDSFLC